MKNLALAVVLLCAAPAGAAKYSYSEKPEVQIENYNSSRMEAKAILGELKYQHGDLSGADETFHESLSASTRLSDPQSHVMALDLYRTAELALRKKDVAGARKHLEILVSRYPDSDWAEKGQRLLEAMEGRKGGNISDEEASAPMLAGLTPAARLRRLQENLRAGRYEAALAGCEDFLDHAPTHPAAREILVLQGALLLQFKDAAAAARSLKGALAGVKDPILRNKALYLLGAADLELGRPQSVLDDVPAAAPAKTWDRWLALAQTWRAAALERLGHGAEAKALYAQVAASGASSPLKSYAFAGAAAGNDLGLMEKAAAEAMKWGQTDLRAAAELAQAHMLYRQKRLEDAADAYGAFALKNAKHPQATLALFQQGLCLKRLDRPAGALKAFEVLVRLHPDSVYAQDAHLQLGQLYAAAGRTEEAIAHYKNLGDEKETLLLTAQIHYNAKRYADAIPLYWDYLRQAPSGERAKEVADLLLTSYWQGAPTDPGLAKAIALYPDHAIVAQIRWGLGAKAYQAADFKAAEESFRRLLLDFPKNIHVSEALFFQAESLMKLSDYRAAAKAYSALLARSPKDANARQARFRLAAAQLESGDYASAAKGFSQVTGKDVMAADALLNAALALARNGQKARVLAVYEQFLKAFPRHSKAAQVWFETAELQQAAGKLSAAAAAYEKSGAYKRGAALFQIAACQDKLKKPALALKALESLADVTPKDDTYRLSGMLRLALMNELKNPVKAMRLYADVLKSAPRLSPAFDTARRRLQALSSDGSLVKR